MKPLAGKTIVTLAGNLPGPIAVLRLQELGAEIIKIEPPTGDPMKSFSPKFYSYLVRGKKVTRLDLKTLAHQKKLYGLLAYADLLVTSNRPRALKNLKLDWKTLHRNFSRLNQVAIVGFSSPHQDKAGHDLTYQAKMGFIQPPNLPLTCFSDVAAANETVIQAMALLVEREKTKTGAYVEVSIADSLKVFGLPLQFSLTGSGKVLGGKLPQYNLYKTKKGWIALAALEDHFLQKLSTHLKLANLDYRELQSQFLKKTAQEWERWANQNDLPLVEVK